MISFQGCDGIELLDWLFDQNDGILRHEEAEHHGNHHNWPIQDTNVRERSLMSLTLTANTCLLSIHRVVHPEHASILWRSVTDFERLSRFLLCFHLTQTD